MDASNYPFFAVFLTLHTSYVILTLAAGLAVLWRARRPKQAGTRACGAVTHEVVPACYDCRVVTSPWYVRHSRMRERRVACRCASAVLGQSSAG